MDKINDWNVSGHRATMRLVIPIGKRSNSKAKKALTNLLQKFKAKLN